MKSRFKFIILILTALVFCFFLVLFFISSYHYIFVMNKSKNTVYYSFRVSPDKDKYTEYKDVELKPNETILLERFGFYGFNKFKLDIGTNTFFLSEEEKKYYIYKNIEFELMPNDGFDYQHQIIIEDSLNYKLGYFRLEYNERK